MSNLILEVKNLSVLIKERFLVKNVSFSLDEGCCLGVLGEDKSGKTSLIKAIGGALPIGEGQVFVDDIDIKANPVELNSVNLCLDPPMFFKFQSVFDNFKYLTTLSGNYDKEKIIKILEKFGLSGKISTKVLFLSYYEKKLMALALAFLNKPKLLLLDEPFKGMTKTSILKIKSYINQLKQSGTAIIVTSRSFEVLEDFCDGFIFMENRSVVKVLSKEECDRLKEGPTYAFVEVKQPNYAGKLVSENFDLTVTLYENKVLFDANEDETAKIVRFLSKNQIEIYKAGFLNKKAEKIFANLAPYFKGEEE